MVGIPGSGKTTLTRIAFPNHMHVSLDKIKKIPFIKKNSILKRYTENNKTLLSQRLSIGRKIEHILMDKALRDGKNIVIDDTNVTREIRKRHVNLAHKYNAKVNVVFFQNIQRAYEQNNNRRKLLEKKVLDAFHNKLEYPHEEEGFEFIQTIY